jgi:hypothetical protein
MDEPVAVIVDARQTPAVGKSELVRAIELKLRGWAMATNDSARNGVDATDKSVGRRRLMLQAGAAAVGGAVAAVVSSAAPASAADGDPLVLGTDNSSTSFTELQYNSSTGNALTVLATTSDQMIYAQNSGTGGAAIFRSAGGAAVRASAEGSGGADDVAVLANSNLGMALKASGSSSMPTIYTTSAAGSGEALLAESIEFSAAASGIPHAGPAISARLRDEGYGNPTANAVVVTNAGTGVGIEVTDHGPDVVKGTGSAIYAHLDNALNSSPAIKAASSGKGQALLATTTSSTGIAVTSGTGVAIIATANAATSSNPAVKAQSNGKGQAVLAANTVAATAPTVQSSSLSTAFALQTTGKAVPAGGAVTAAGNGNALNVVGVAKFSRSGVAQMTTAGSSLLITVPGGLSLTSGIVATLQLNSGTLAVRAVVPNASNGTATIYFTGAVPVGAKIAWFVIG